MELPMTGAVIAAASGGADSTALLLGIAELKKRKKLAIEITAVHFNHELRGKESEADEGFVRDLAFSLGVEFEVGSGTLKGKGDLEQRAREARYKFLEKAAAKSKALLVLTAHTVNDQAETFLLNLIRGSGPNGLAAMRPTRTLSEARSGGFGKLNSEIILARPLLRWATRSDTEAFCNENGIRYREDSMNYDMGFTRVRIRRELLPKLVEFNPKIVETLARTATLLSEPGAATTGFFDPERDRKELPLKDLRNLPQTDLYRMLREWLGQQRGDLRGVSLKHIESVERLIHSQKSGRIVEIPHSGRVIKASGRLRFENR